LDFGIKGDGSTFHSRKKLIMSGIEVVGIVLAGIVPLLQSGWVLLQQDYQDFGIVPAVALRLGLFDAKGVVDEVREHFIKGDGGLDQAMAFKDSYTPTFNMVGVAGAILAQIALTALGLPNLDDMHWTARATFVMGLVAGSLAVFCSCVLQSKMSSLHNAHAVRMWLTRPNEKWSGLRPKISDLEAPSMLLNNLNNPDVILDTKDLAGLATMNKTLSRLNKMSNEKAYRPSLSAALIITAPSQLLNVALGSLLTGFGIYFGCVYSSKLPAIEDNHSALAVLVLYIASAASGLLLFYFPVLIKLVATMRDQERNRIEEMIMKLNSAIHARQQADAVSKQEDVLSALQKIVSIQEAQLKLQEEFQTLLKARFHPPGSHPPDSRPPDSRPPGSHPPGSHPPSSHTPRF
jgi:uncharacterized membrane protein YedE/YeeE